RGADGGRHADRADRRAVAAGHDGRAPARSGPVTARARRRPRVEDVPTTVDRLLPDEDAEALLALTRDIASRELAPYVDAMEERAEFPADAYRVLGRTGLLSLPFPEDVGGGAQP